MRLIDADALERDFPIRINHYDEEHGNLHFVLGIETVIEYVQDMPTIEAVPVQPEPKRGEWMEDRLVSTSGGTYVVRRCSLCEAYYYDSGFGWNFCPHCGAEMRGNNNE